MINTPAFESLERYLRLKRALRELSECKAHFVYHFIKDALHAAIGREEVFVEANIEQWTKELYEKSNP